MSKGSNRRPGEGYESNWDKIFGKKSEDPVNMDELYRYEIISRDNRKQQVSSFETYAAALDFIQKEVDSHWPNWDINSHTIHYVKRG